VVTVGEAITVAAFVTLSPAAGDQLQEVVGPGPLATRVTEVPLQIVAWAGETLTEQG